MKFRVIINRINVTINQQRTKRAPLNQIRAGINFKSIMIMNALITSSRWRGGGKRERKRGGRERGTWREEEEEEGEEGGRERVLKEK